MPVDPQLGPQVVAQAVALATRGAPVLHDLSLGGLAVAIAEICIASDVGADLDDRDWRDWLTESPHRFLAVVAPDFDIDCGSVPSELIGTIGGDHIDFGRSGRVAVAAAAGVWRESLRSLLD